jgi:hypothetical protein
VNAVSDVNQKVRRKNWFRRSVGREGRVGSPSIFLENLSIVTNHVVGAKSIFSGPPVRTRKGRVCRAGGELDYLSYFVKFDDRAQNYLYLQTSLSGW